MYYVLTHTGSQPVIGPFNQWDKAEGARNELIRRYGIRGYEVRSVVSFDQRMREIISLGNNMDRVLNQQPEDDADG